MVFWPNLNNIPINEEEIVQLPSEYSLLLEVNNQPIVKKHELINEVKPSLLLEQLRVVVVSGKKDYMIDDLLIYNLMKIKQNKKDSRKSPLISTLIYSQIGKIIFERNSAQKQGKIVICFNLPYQIDYASSLVLSQLFSSSDFKNNLKDILIKHQLISDFQILYETNQIMKLSFSTTNKGMHNSNIIIAIISKYIGQLSSMDYKNVKPQQKDDYENVKNSSWKKNIFYSAAKCPVVPDAASGSVKQGQSSLKAGKYEVWTILARFLLQINQLNPNKTAN